MCETKLIVQKSMQILSYSDECGNDHNLTSGTQSHQKNWFRNLELLIGVVYIFRFFLSTGLDKKEKYRLPLTCLKSILGIA